MVTQNYAQSPFDPSAFLLAFLPSLNNGVLRGEISVQAFLNAVKEPVKELVVAAHRPTLNRDVARSLLGQLGMLLSSAERHTQASKQPAGAALAHFEGIDAALDRLGQVGDHPPRDSAYSLWLWNRAGYTFTGDRQEQLFRSTVERTVESVETICHCLRFVASPMTHLDSVDAIRSIEQASDLQEHSYRLLGGLGKHDHSMKAPTFSGQFFTLNLRTWLTTFPVAGRTWEGPSAANFAAFWEADVRLIPTPSFYRGYVEGRLHTLPGEEQSRVRTAMSQATVEDRILSSIGINRAQALDLDDVTIERLIRSAGIKAFLKALERYVTIATRWTSAHLALVRKKLEDTAAAAGDIVGKLPVDPNLGTGGGDWRMELRQILEMRANPPVLLRLFETTRANQAGKTEKTGLEVA